MPPAIPEQTIIFENNREATAVFPLANAPAQEIVDALKIKGHESVLVLIGGADSVDDKLKPRLIQLFGRGIARAAVTVRAVIIDGGTKAGIMEMMGQGVADRGYQSFLIGVAPLGLVNYPGSTGAGETPLDPNHSHFVLVDGNAWGSETSTIYKLVRELRTKLPTVALIAGGGSVSKNEALQAVRQNIPLIVVEGSGGAADEIATAWKAKPDLPEEPVMAEIIADGRIEFHRLSNPVKGAERLILRELGGDNVLLQAWERFADYDLNAVLQQERFQRMQLTILVLGLLATALALIKQVNNPTGEFNRGDTWWYVYYILLLIPIILTILITAANRFKQGNKWLLLRGGAEAIKREIYKYRARAVEYKEVFNVAPPTPPPPGTPPPPPPPTPEQVLAQRVEDVTRRVMQTEVNTSSLIPYNKDQGFPPNMYGAQGGDDGFSVLTPDRYVQVRLGDQLNYYRRKAVKLERKLKLIQWSIFIFGGLGTLLAAINKQVWIALTTALAAALATYLSYQQTENTLMKYNQASTDLDSVKRWWTALPAEDQGKQDNVDALVDHTEKVLQSELDGWVQQMQNALEELRKAQAPTDEEKAAAAKALADKAAAEKTAVEKNGNGGGGGANGGGEGAAADEVGVDAGVDEAGGENAGADEAGGEDAGADDAGENAGGDDAGGENGGADDAGDDDTVQDSTGADGTGDDKPDDNEAAGGNT